MRKLLCPIPLMLIAAAIALAASFVLPRFVSAAVQSQTYTGTPKCNPFTEPEGRKCIGLTCTGSVPATGNCPGRFPTQNACQRIPAVCGTDSYFESEIKCLVNSGNMAQAGWSYYCGETDTSHSSYGNGTGVFRHLYAV